MPIIAPKLSWPYKGHNYDTEIEAVKAAIDDMGKRLVKDHASNPGEGLILLTDLPLFLLRYHELTKQPETAPTESPEGTRSEELEGTRDEGTRDEGVPVERLADAMQGDGL